MDNIIVLSFLAITLICYGSLVGTDVYNRQKLRRRSTTYLRWQHLLVLSVTVLLAVFVVLLFTSISWEQEGIILLLYGLCITGINVWDLRSIMLHPIEPERLQPSDRKLKRTAIIVVLMSCMFNTFMLAGGIAWTLIATVHYLQSSLIVPICMLVLMFLFMGLIASLYNRWHKQALEIAYEQRQSMPADYASEIEAEYQELSEQRTQGKSLVGWRIKSFLIGLCPSVILFVLPIVVSQLHWSKWILILGWALFGILAIAQPFIRMVPAMAPLPTGATGKKLIQEYTQLEMFDGISASAIAIILSFTTLIARPTSLIVLGIVAGGACLIVASAIFLWYRKIQIKDRKQSSTSKKQPQKVTGDKTIQFSAILLTARRMLVFCWLFAYIERAFEDSIQLLIFVYWFIFIAVITCVVLLMYNRQLTGKFPEAH